jgi:hypothetical protein
VAGLTAHSEGQGRPPTGIQFSILPFRHESLVRSSVIVESNAMVPRIIGLGGITYLLHTPD